MQHLIYLSSASYLFSDVELIELLNKSRLNNTKLDITGLLLYHEVSILQILEGEEEVINKLFLKISSDSRHRSIIKMIDCEVPERSFKDWSMGFRKMSHEDWLTVEGYFSVDNKGEFTSLTKSATSAMISIIKSFSYVNNMHKMI